MVARIIDTTTIKGIETAERLQAKGWTIVQSRLFSVVMKSPRKD